MHGCVDYETDSVLYKMEGVMNADLRHQKCLQASSPSYGLSSWFGMVSVVVVCRWLGPAGSRRPGLGVNGSTIANFSTRRLVDPPATIDGSWTWQSAPR